MKKIIGFLKSRKFLLCAVLFLSLIVVNVTAALLPFRIAHPDVSGATTYRISESSRRYLASLNEDVDIIYHCKGGSASVDEDLYPFLLQFTDANERITVTVQNATEDSDRTLEIRSTRRSRTLSIPDLYYYFCATTNEMLSPAEYARIVQMLAAAASDSNYDQTVYEYLYTLYGTSSVTAYFSGEGNLTDAIRYVLAESAPTVYHCSVGNSEGLHLLLRQKLERSGCGVQTLLSTEQIPSDCRVLYLTVSADLSASAATSLSAWLASGGKLFLVTSSDLQNIPNLSSVLNGYGLSLPENTGVVLDGGQAFSYATVGSHPATETFRSNFVVSYPRVIRVAETEGVTTSVLLKTSESSYYAEITEEGEQKVMQESVAVCVAAERENSSVIWLSMPLSSLVNGLSSDADFGFVMHCVDWLAEIPTPASFSAAVSLPSDHLSAGSTFFILWILLLALLVPVVLVITGIVRRYIRKKRR